MARKRMVTRTIESTEAKILCLNVDTCEPSNIAVVLAGTFKSEDELLNTAKKFYETDDTKLVKVVDARIVSAIYKMNEEKFIHFADEVVEISSNNQ